MRLLHTMLRVGNLDKSIAFYTDVLGMKLLRRRDYPMENLPWLSWVMVTSRKTP